MCFALLMLAPCAVWFYTLRSAVFLQCQSHPDCLTLSWKERESDHAKRKMVKGYAQRGVSFTIILLFHCCVW